MKIKSLIRAGIVVVLLAVTQKTSYAVGFVRVGDLGESAGPHDQFSRTHHWFWDGIVRPGERNPIGPEGTRWITELRDPQPGTVGGTRNLRVTIQHQGGPEFPFSPDGFTQNAGAVGISGYVQQASHGAGNMDIARLTVEVAQAGEPAATVKTSGLHIAEALRARLRMEGSLRNTRAAGQPAFRDVEFTPDYRRPKIDPATGMPEIDPATGKVVLERVFGRAMRPDSKSTPRGIVPYDGRLNPGEGAAITFPTGEEAGFGKDARLASYIVTASGSPHAETHLAFLGEVDGTLAELDLDAAAMLFSGDDEFLVPFFLDDSEGLFTTVDLTQWLSASTTFVPVPGQSFSFTDGLSHDLPGFLVSRSEINFVPGTGYVASDDPSDPNDGPFSGQLLLAGLIDGQAAVIPEPATLTLFGIGTLGLLGNGWRHRRKVV